MAENFGQRMVLAAPCQRNGCTLPALVVPRLCVPVRGAPRFEPFSVLIGIEVCRTHLAALRPQDYLTKLVRGGVKHFMRRAGAEPDFEQAWIAELHVMSQEYLRMKRDQVAANGGVLWDEGKRA